MLLLLGQGFFMGILIASLTVGAETLFVSTVGEHYLAEAFFLSGFTGIISAGLYVQFQKKINFSTLLLSISFLVFVFITAIRFAFWFTDYKTDHLGFHYLPFILFVMMGPLVSITILAFWGVFGRIWDLKQAKRIIGGIDTGQLVATMIAFFSIPVLSALGIIDETHDLLLLSTIAAFGILIFSILIVKDFNLDSATKIRPSDAKVRKITYADLVKDKYLRMLCVFMPPPMPLQHPTYPYHSPQVMLTSSTLITLLQNQSPHHPPPTPSTLASESRLATRYPKLSSPVLFTHSNLPPCTP